MVEGAACPISTSLLFYINSVSTYYIKKICTVFYPLKEIFSQFLLVYKKQKVDKKTDKEIFVSISPFRKIKHPLFNRNFNCSCQFLPTSH